MGGVVPFTLLEDIFSYTSKDRAEKHILSIEIPSGAGVPPKEEKI